jgi:hypothetical protein
MNDQQLEIFKSRMIQACDAFVAKRGKIVQGGFCNLQGQCPIGCLLNPYVEGILVHEQLTNLLGFPVSNTEAWDFIYGFDANLDANRLIQQHRAQQPLFQFATELRIKYLGVSK